MSVPVNDVHSLRNTLNHLISHVNLNFTETSTGTSKHPWDRSLYFERVNTFSLANWAGFPNSLSPLAVARWGWKSIGPNLIKCTTCNQVLCFAITKKTIESDAVAEVCSVYAQQLNVGHTETCFWRGNPCPKSISEVGSGTWEDESRMFGKRAMTICEYLNTGVYKLPAGCETMLFTSRTANNDISKALMSIVQRAESQTHPSTEIHSTDTPTLSTCTRPLVSPSTAHENTTPSDNLLTNNYVGRETVSSIMLALAVSGWEVGENEELMCKYCRRQLTIIPTEHSNMSSIPDYEDGRSTLNDSDISQNNNPVQPAVTVSATTQKATGKRTLPVRENSDSFDRPSKKAKQNIKCIPDPIHSHRAYCPWVQPVEITPSQPPLSSCEQSETDTIAGWLAYRDFLANTSLSRSVISNSAGTTRSTTVDAEPTASPYKHKTPIQNAERLLGLVQSLFQVKPTQSRR
eukprot:CFRG4063T1